MSNHFRIRLRLGPDDAFDIVVKPFDELTTADHIRIYESEAKDEGYNELDRTKNRLVRITGAPDRFIRFMRQHEVEELVRVINEQTAAQDRTLGTLAKVYETLNNWEKEHNGKAWTIDDARAVLEDHSLFTTTIEVNGRTYTAPLVEEATFGQWIDLQAAMDMKGLEAESMGYVRALSILMQGEDGPYPVQANDESDADYRAFIRERFPEVESAKRPSEAEIAHARRIVDAIAQGEPVVYAPAKWWLIMMVIRHLPRAIFNKLNI